MWPLLIGFEPLPKLRNRQELLDRTERMTMDAEVCHGAPFILVSLVALFYLAAGRFSDAVWIVAFNILFNTYPVMLQRVNRWRVQQVRASEPPRLKPAVGHTQSESIDGRKTT
jgi:hypothetical protein